MFQKIMPVLAGNPFADLSGTEQFQPETNEISNLRARLAPRHSNVVAQHPMPHNIQELLVDDLIDSVVQKFNCCSCDCCRRAIAAAALNSLPPQYVAQEGEQLQQTAQQMEQREVYNALIKAVLKVRAKPPHHQ